MNQEPLFQDMDKTEDQRFQMPDGSSTNVSLTTIDRTARYSGTDKRRYPRRECLASALVKVVTWSGRKTLDGIIHDASAKGVRLELPNDHILNHGDRITVRWKTPPDIELASSSSECVSTGTVVRARTSARLPNTYGVRFDHLVDDQIRETNARYQKAAVVIIAFLLAIDILVLKISNLTWFWYAPLFQGYSVVVSLYILSKVLFSFLYREPRDNGYMPDVSIIIAAKNEELHITQTIRNCFASRYPINKLEVMAVDDGSTDKTWEVLNRLKLEFPQLTIFKFDKNRGKRHAMAWGAQHARGEILIYIDSDSFIEPESVYKLVQPLSDSEVGAVAGHCLVEVEKNNIISKMEAVRYFVSQRILKAAESVFSAVTCCPGPFSAYRKSLVLSFLPQWEFQKFMGAQATFGDDRSLTNFVLRRRYRVVFHYGAIVRTYVPNTWKTFFRQQLRWKKSWCRETIIASRFMWRLTPFASIPYYTGIVMTLFSPIVALHALIYMPVFMNANALSYLAGLGLINVFLSALYYYFTRSRYWYYMLFFGGLYLAVLCWQTYYAMLTVKENQWGTR